MADKLINKVAESGLISLDLETFFPNNPILEFDMKNYLFRELLLKEKEFRTALQQQDWSIYKDKIVALHCSTDAILPQWSYMLVVSYLSAQTHEIYFGNTEKVEYLLFIQNIKNMNTENYKDARVVIKGCGTKAIQGDAYIEISKKLQPVVKSLMFGEACSTVPVYKKKN